MSQFGVKRGRFWCLAIALVFTEASSRTAQAQENLARAIPAAPATGADAPSGPVSLPPSPSDPDVAAAQPGDGSPVFLDPKSLSANSTRRLGFQASPSPDTRPGVLRRPIDDQPVARDSRAAFPARDALAVADGSPDRIHGAIGRDAHRGAGVEPLRPDRGSMADRLPGLGPLRQRTPDQ